MRKVSKLASMLLIALSAPLASALSLEELLDSVDRNFPDIAAADARTAAQEALITRARGAFDPNVTLTYERTPDGTYVNEHMSAKLSGQIPETPLKLGAQVDKLNGKVPVYEGDLATGSEGRVKVFAEVPLLRGLVTDKNRAGTRKAVAAKENASEDARQVRLTTYRAAALAYWAWSAAVEKQRAVETLLNAVREREKTISKRITRGEAPRIDAIDNQRVTLQRQAQLELAKLEVTKAELNLALYWRDAQGQPIRPALSEAPVWLLANGDLTKGRAEESKERLETHPIVRALRAELEQKQVEQRLGKYNLLPQLDLTASMAEYRGEPPAPRTDARESTIGLRFSMPLFNREFRGEAAAANWAVRASEEKLRLAQQKLETDFEKSTSEVRTAWRIYQLIYQEMGLADQVEAAERKRFQSGESSLLNVNLREQDAILARVRAIDALYVYRDRELDYRLLTNTWIRRY